MNLAQARCIAELAMRGRRTESDRPPGYILFHGRRTARIALELADEIDAAPTDGLGRAVSRDVLYAGALFHDVGKGLEPHNEIGARRARELLAGTCRAVELDQIAEIVANHNRRGESASQSVAVRLVQDADSLDHVGVIGPWLAFYHIARGDGTVADALRYAATDTLLADRTYMRSMLNFDSAIQRFDLRLAFEAAYYNALERAMREE